MKRLLFLLALSGCSGPRTIPLGSATPLMFRDCTKACESMGLELDRIYVSASYGARTNGGSYCALYAKCECQVVRNAQTIKTLVALPTVYGVNIDFERGSAFAKDACKEFILPEEQR